MANKFRGKVAVITGGSSGMGLATAKRFIQEGMDHVFITGRRKDVLEAAVDAIGANVTGVQGDVSKLGDRRIRVNAISPGHIDTPIFEGWQQGEALSNMKKDLAMTVPLGRMGDPDEIAKAVSFLASEDGSYISGIELFVDGGVAQI